MVIKSRKNSIFRKFLKWVLIFVFLAIFITSLILSFASHFYFRKTIEQNYHNIIVSSAGEIGLFMKSAQKGLENLAAILSATNMGTWQKDIALTAFLQVNTQFMFVTLFGLNGDVIASTEWESEGMDFPRTEAFKKAAIGLKAISGVGITPNQIPHVHMTVPLKHRGKVKGVLWGQINLKSVWEILKGIKIGRTGQIYILDLSGRYLAHQEIDRVVRPLAKDDPALRAKLREANVVVEWIEKKNTATYYCLGSYVPELDWVIVLEQEIEEIYANLYQNFFWSLWMIIVFCGAAALLVWLWVKRLLKPVRTLHHQVNIITKGDLDHKISLNTNDEIGELGHAFNKMTDALKQKIKNEVEQAKTLAHTKNLAILGTTSSKVTHEIKNLLNNITLTVNQLKQKERLSEGGRRQTQILENESERIQVFIENYLGFAKKPDLKITRIKMDIIIWEALAILNPTAKKKNITLELDWPPPYPGILRGRRQGLSNFYQSHSK